MKKSITKIALTASIALALTFTSGCGEVGRSDDNPNSNNSTSNPDISSSSSEENNVSSSSSYGGSVCPNASTVPVDDLGIGSMTCGGKTYKTVKIGEQVWMAENINYGSDGSKCYKNQDSYCTQYGRLYNWTMAINVCPEGWHLPSYDEWRMLIYFAGGSEAAGPKLKATQGWYNNGEDTYGFAALPGGYYYRDVDEEVGIDGLVANWWSATEYDLTRAYSVVIDVLGIWYHAPTMGEGDKTIFYSVRCMQD